jgi:hypothetical protein
MGGSVPFDDFSPGGNTIAFDGMFPHNVQALVRLGSDHEGGEEKIVPDDVDITVGTGGTGYHLSGGSSRPWSSWVWAMVL